MAHILVMPRQGNTVESCILVEWKKKEGDPVKADEPVCEVETDKAVFEVNAGAEGIVLKILRQAGDDVPVLEAIALIGKPGEDISGFLVPGAQAPGLVDSGEGKPMRKGVSTAKDARPLAAEAERPGTESARNAAESMHEPGELKASPRARKLAGGEALEIALLRGTGPEGRVIERDVRAALDERGPLTASAKEALKESPSLTAPYSQGSGIGGRAGLADLVKREARAQGSPAAAMRISGAFVDAPIRSVRKIIADRMLESLSTTAQFTLAMSARAEGLIALRKRFKESPEALGLRGITLNDLVLYAVAKTLPQFPFMNAHKLGDTLRTFSDIHLGCAVDTPRGLVVPVIRQADSLSLKAISAEAKRLAEACQKGSALPDELCGSTFTVTNLGGLGVESFTPVLNAPEVGILGVCGIKMEAATGEDDEMIFERRMGFSLTINHQVVDGAPAARFLKALCDTLADIDLVLLA